MSKSNYKNLWKGMLLSKTEDGFWQAAYVQLRGSEVLRIEPIGTPGAKAIAIEEMKIAFVKRIIQES